MSPDERIKIADVPALVSGLTGEKRSRQTIYNWINKGITVAGQNFKLRTTSLAGQTFTCAAWVDEFLAKVDQQ